MILHRAFTSQFGWDGNKSQNKNAFSCVAIELYNLSAVEMSIDHSYFLVLKQHRDVNTAYLEH